MIPTLGSLQGSTSHTCARGRAEDLQAAPALRGAPVAGGPRCSSRVRGDSGATMQMETVPAHMGLQGGHRHMRLKLHSKKIIWLVRSIFLVIFCKCKIIHGSNEQKENQLIHISGNYLYTQLQVSHKPNCRFQELSKSWDFRHIPLYHSHLGKHQIFLLLNCCFLLVALWQPSPLLQQLHPCSGWG